MVILVVAPLLGAADGTALFHARRFAEAEKTWRARVAARPADWEARLWLARALIELRRVPEALAEIERVANPAATPEARYQAGVLLRQLAEQRFADLEQAAPGSPAVLHLTAQRLERQGNHAAALLQYRAAAQLDPQRPGVHYAIGNVLWRMRELDGAESELRRELTRNPRHGMAQFRLGQVLIARGQEAGAVTPLEAAASALPGQLEIRRELGKAYRKAGRLAEARRLWEAIAAARPGDDQVHSCWGPCTARWVRRRCRKHRLHGTGPAGAPARAHRKTLSDCQRARSASAAAASPAALSAASNNSCAACNRGAIWTAAFAADTASAGRPSARFTCASAAAGSAFRGCRCIAVVKRVAASGKRCS